MVTTSENTGLRDIFSSIREDVRMIIENDPALNSSYELVLYLGLWALITYRFANYIYRQFGLHFFAKLMSLIARILTGVEIHPAAKIGQGVFIDHGCGVVIGETAVIGNNCVLFHGCTLGGNGKECGKRHPTIGDRVIVGAGAKIIGNITLGNDVKVGAGSVVVKSAPDNCTIVGIPGRCVPKKIVYVEDKNHQEALPDVDAKAIRALYRRNLRLEENLDHLGQLIQLNINKPKAERETILELADDNYLAIILKDCSNMIYADGI